MVATEIDFDSTIVATTTAGAEALLNTEGLEALSSRATGGSTSTGTKSTCRRAWCTPLLSSPLSLRVAVLVRLARIGALVRARSGLPPIATEWTVARYQRGPLRAGTYISPTQGPQG